MVVENRSEGLTEPQTTPRNLLHSQDRSASTPEGLAGEPVRAVSLAVLSTGPSRRQQSMLPLLEKSSHFPHNGESTVSGKVDPSLYPIKTRTAKSAKGAKRQSCRRKSLNRRRRALQHREDNSDRTRDWMAGAPGFEPGITGPKPVALPLGYAPTTGGKAPCSAERLMRFTGRGVQETDGGGTILLDRGRLTFLTPEAIAQRYGGLSLPPATRPAASCSGAKFGSQSMSLSA